MEKVTLHLQKSPRSSYQTGDAVGLSYQGAEHPQLQPLSMGAQVLSTSDSQAQRVPGEEDT